MLPLQPMPPAPQSYALQTSPITTSYSRMSAINREDLLSETTDHTEENDDDNDDDDDDEYSDDESEGDDIDMTPPGSSSDHYRRCQEDLTRYNHPYVMGHKRSLWASIQTDTKRPARRNIIKISDDNEFKETPGTSSSMHAPPMLQDPPLVNDDIVPALKTAGVPRMIVSVQYPIKEEGQQPLQLEHPPMASTLSSLHKMSCILEWQIWQPLSHIECALHQPNHHQEIQCLPHVVQRQEHWLRRRVSTYLQLQTKTANSCRLRRQVTRQSLTVVHLHLVLDCAAASVTLDLHHAVSQRLSERLPSLLRWDYSHHSCSRLLSLTK